MTEVKTIKCEIHCQNGESLHAAFPAVPGIWEREEIYVEVEEAVEDLYDTPEGQEYKKLLEEKQQGVAHRAARYYRFDKKIYNKIRR